MTTLDFMSQQLEILSVLPDDLEQRQSVINRALDVRSASMVYLAVSIRHYLEHQVQLFLTSLTAGKIIKTFFLGDDKITDSKAYLEKSVDNYTRALSNIVGVRMIIKVWEIVKGNKLSFGQEINRDRNGCTKCSNPKRAKPRLQQNFMFSIKRILDSQGGRNSCKH
jgi:hypothetical protein